MKLQRPQVQNALKHGIFLTAPPTGEPSEFANLARSILPEHRAEIAASDVEAAEERTRRCRAVISERLSELDAFFETSCWDAEHLSRRIEASLHELDRLLRYQTDGINKLRKCRLAILNTAEGIKLGSGRGD